MHGFGAQPRCCPQVAQDPKKEDMKNKENTKKKSKGKFKMKKTEKNTEGE